LSTFSTFTFLANVEVPSAIGADPPSSRTIFSRMSASSSHW
jgi:hypothetical protein